LNTNPPIFSSPTWWKTILLCLGLAGVGAVTLLSLRSSPAISTVRWIPQPIARWADRHGRSCNFVAYGIVGLPLLMLTPSPRRQLGIVLLMSLGIAALEVIQFALPSRVCDVWDIFYGVNGVLTAWGIVRTGMLLKSIRSPQPQPNF